MVALLRRQRLIVPLALLGGAASAMLIAALVAITPEYRLEQFVLDSGLAAVFASAAPPLGFTARLALTVMAGGGVGGFVWFGLTLLLGRRTISLGQPARSVAEPATVAEELPVPTLRRADAHPDAPPRRPLFAAQDLGTPFLEVRAPPPTRKLPDDLDQPLAMFDPAALRPDPLPRPEAVAPLARPRIFEPEERFETFDLPVRSMPPPLLVPDYAPIENVGTVRRPAEQVAELRQPETATIHALLNRLERGVAKRELDPNPVTPERHRANDDSLREALGVLRKLATRAG